MSTNNRKYYGTLPVSADKEAINAFTLAIPEVEISRMKTLINLSRVSSQSYENTYAVKSRGFGLSREWLIAAKERWESTFDWRQQEKLVNSFPNFKTQLPVPGETTIPDKLNVHFAALFSKKRNAIPILFLHGWPGSFFEFLPMMRLLKEKYPDEDTFPYHIVVPSLTGYGLSDPAPLNRDFDQHDLTSMMDHLMVKILGFSRYVAQGGDVGSRIARELCLVYDSCYAVHLNCQPVTQPPGMSLEDLDDMEKKGQEREKEFWTTGAGYAIMHATKPATTGFVLSSSPIALLAWVAEKMLDWSDPASFPPSPNPKLPGEKLPYSLELMDEILAGVSLYFLTEHVHTSLWFYRGSRNISEGTGRSKATTADEPIEAPKKLGFSWFPFETVPSPISWIATTGNLVYSKKHAIGGHFAALEQPAALLEDVEEFIRIL